MNHSQEIRSFVSDSFFVDDFGEDDSFLQEGIIDSTGMMELVAFLESRFGIKISDEELVPENLDSLSNVSRFVGRKLTQAA